MKVQYDKAAYAIYIRLTDSKVVDSEEVRPGIVLDYDAKDRVVSMEIRSVSKQLPDADVGRMQLEVASRE